MTKPFYIVPMFPYPSGRLHMGHVRNYAISDCIARHYRRQGREVLHPIGWDAFGLPAENAARESGADPRQWTDTNIQAMRQQLAELRFEFSPGHELATHHDDYIFQGQKLFLAFYRAGLIERRMGEVWWDPIDQTVLANEQVVDGKGWRSGAQVERKALAMLFARTRDMGPQLARGLDGLQWPSQAIAAQKAWIGFDETDGSMRLHDWCLSRQRSWGTPVPLVECSDCGEVPAGEDMLPLRNMPTQPTAEDRSCTCPACGKEAVRSSETLDTFWDSAFYTYAYPHTRNDRVEGVAGDDFAKFGGVDLYVGGLEHATMHLLYARWFARAMRQVGFEVPEEPFPRLIGQGMVRAPAYRNDQQEWVAPCDVVSQEDTLRDKHGNQVACVGTVKMSKSKKNGVDPAQAIADFGPEAVRFAMLFAAPFAMEIDWTDDNIRTAARHLDRMERQAAIIAAASGSGRCSSMDKDTAILRSKIVPTFESMDGVNALMGTALGVWHGAQQAARGGHGASARQAAVAVADALWPIAPDTIERAMRVIDPAWIAGAVSHAAVQNKPMVIQINGVKRAIMEQPADTQDGAIQWLQTQHADIVEQFLPYGVERVVWVPGRIMNIVGSAAPTNSPTALRRGKS